ncbi:MAG: hypothetical protein AB2693_26230 [Candidatus Thiodiazotropha sp.]
MNGDERHDIELSIFQHAPTDTSVQTMEWIEYRPVNQLSDGVPLEFNVSPQSSAYVDLKRSLLNVKLRLVGTDNAPIQDADVVGLVNLPLHSIFSQIELSLQQTPLGHTGTNYPYKAYIDTLLKTSETQQNHFLSSQLFYKDKGDHDDSDAKTGANGGLYARAKYTAGGKVLDLEGPLHLDLFQQPRIMVSGVEIGLKLWPSQNAFRLMANATIPAHKVQIVDAKFKVCLQKLNPALLVAHENVFKNTTALYPYLRSEIKTASIASGQFSFSIDDMYQGLVPNRLTVGLVSSGGYMGDYKKSPFKFQTYDCNFVGLYVDGQSLPTQPLQPNYATENFVDCYNTLTAYRNDISVDRGEYARGYCLYVLNLDPYYSFNTKRKGHCRLELKFAKALPESVTVIMYATFPEVLCIDQSRRVYIQ